jgi:hypothetical protein
MKGIFHAISNSAQSWLAADRSSRHVRPRGVDHRPAELDRTRFEVDPDGGDGLLELTPPSTSPPDRVVPDRARVAFDGLAPYL